MPEILTELKPVLTTEQKTEIIIGVLKKVINWSELSWTDRTYLINKLNEIKND